MFKSLKKEILDRNKDYFSLYRDIYSRLAIAESSLKNDNIVWWLTVGYHGRKYNHLEHLFRIYINEKINN